MMIELTARADMYILSEIALKWRARYNMTPEFVSILCVSFFRNLRWYASLAESPRYD